LTPVYANYLAAWGDWRNPWDSDVHSPESKVRSSES
jgi:hypothetical protein